MKRTFGKQVQSRELKVQAPKLKSPEAVNIPELFSIQNLEWQEGVSVHLGKRRMVTVVPPKGIMKENRVDFPAVLENPTSWLLVMEDDFGELNGKEVEVIPSSKKGTVGIRLLRSSGHVVAEGAGTLQGKDAITFELKLLGKGVSKKQPQTVFRGSLTADKQWRFETTL